MVQLATALVISLKAVMKTKYLDVSTQSNNIFHQVAFYILLNTLSNIKYLWGYLSSENTFEFIESDCAFNGVLFLFLISHFIHQAF